MNSYLAAALDSALVWIPELGLGRYPVADDRAVYDREYFERFARQADSPIGRALNEARLELVRRFGARDVVDVGIGCGAFVEALGCRGFDVNPAGVEWLQARGAFVDPWSCDVEALTFWDSLEHIDDPEQLLRRARRFVFVSLPIFEDLAHVRRSKHFRPTEHFWYFTRDGFVRFMQSQGFELAHESRVESEIGREDIGTFVFKRHGGAEG